MTRYEDCAHRAQTAIAVLIGNDSSYTATQPKHLRVGIDLSKSDQAALANLFIARGIFTIDEYVDALTKEALSYEKQVQSILGNKNIFTR